MSIRSTYLILLVIAFSAIFSACNKKEITVPVEGDEPEINHTIRLSWFQNDDETRAHVESGLLWCFSYLGAKLPVGSFEEATRWSTDNVVSVDFSKLGFNSNALSQINRIITVFKQSEEYQQTNTADLGRFVFSIFNNSNHYYEITGVPTRLLDFENSRPYNKRHGVIVESAVSKVQRIVLLPENGEITSMIFKSLELEGSILGAHNVKEFELFDIMENGQLRFAIYDENGRLITGANPTYSTAGKPAKCFWCHESTALRGFAAKTNVPDYYSVQQFDSIIEESNEMLADYRQGMLGDVDFKNVQEHTELEKIYIRFMEPSAKRIAAEWRMSVDEVSNRLKTLPTHIHHEFPEMGPLYDRKDVDKISPFPVIPVSEDAREVIGSEPNLTS